MKQTSSKRKTGRPPRAVAQKWVDDLAGRNPDGVYVKSWQQGWGTLQFGRSINKSPLCLAGKTYADGLGSHADSEIVIGSERPMKRFRAMAGVDDNPNSRISSAARMVFSVEVQGRELWRSPILGVASSPVPVDVALPADTCELVLRAKAAGGMISYAHADWADAVVTVGQAAVRFEGGPLANRLPHGSGPFSFVYGGKASADLLPGWKRSDITRRGPRGETVDEVTWRDPGTGLECRMELSAFDDFPVVEWILHFRNTGKTNTPILENVQALNLDWETSGETALFRSRGSGCVINDFEYLRETLNPGTAFQMAAGGGRSSNTWLPFFNLQSGDAGVLSAIGWSGQWAAEFSNTWTGVVQMRAGMEQVHLTLHPGETIRSPRMLLLFWTGDRMASHNELRRFLLQYHVPRPNGHRLQGPLTAAHWGGMKTQGHLERIAAYRRARMDYDYYWIDAGWYGPADSYSPDEFTGDWAKHVGNWTVNPAAHPDGLRPIADAAEGAGMKFMLWFEPERAIVDTPWTVEHPDWFLGERKPGANLLLDLGNPAARRGVTDHILAFLERNHIMLYRQDFNFDPLPYWRANDAPDRQGMTEIRHIEGFYQFWDELLEKRPGLVIDNCASGGRRIDLETISRSIPLWRSDWQCWPTNDPIGGQVHGMGLSHWVPLHGTGVYSSQPASAGDVYRVRSCMGPALQFSIFPYEKNAVDPHYPWAWHRRMIRDIRRTQPLFTGDYYPLSNCTAAADVWAAYQMHRADLGEGFVMVLRRKESPFSRADYHLQGLEPRATYELEDADTGRTRRVKGKVLLEKGVLVDLDRPHTSKLIFYRKIGRVS